MAATQAELRHAGSNKKELEFEEESKSEIPYLMWLIAPIMEPIPLPFYPHVPSASEAKVESEDEVVEASEALSSPKALKKARSIY
ncbi:MAG: hypothetical protein R2865_05420 [Deinococcales bacterium]